MGQTYLWGSQGLDPWPLLFSIYINDLPTLINKHNNIVLFADDTSVIITDNDDFTHNVNKLFKNINNWLDNNTLNLNFKKTYYLEFRTKKQLKVNVQIEHNQKFITSTSETKFLGFIIDDTLTWTQHIEYLFKKMASAFRFVKQSLPEGTQKIIYFAHVHTIIS